MTGPELSPCPFDGGQGVPESVLRDGYEAFPDDPDARAYFVRCLSCAAEGPWNKSSKAGAIAAWNRRSPAHPDTPREEQAE